ncbi:MAG: SPOR domain-containing protein [Paracoccaceae bacterium]
MADIPYGGRAPAPAAPAQPGNALQTLGTVTNWAGAVVSLGLVVGIGIWGYRMIARDVSGVPVVRAASDAPMRVAPKDPGGEAALHQGLAVNSVAAEGAAARPAERLVLAPAPVSLSDEDQPRHQVLAAAVPQDEPEDPAETPQMGSIRALAEQLASGAAPLEAAPALETVQQVAAVVPPAAAPANPEPAEEAAAARPEVKGGMKRSLRPMTRPGGLRETVQQVAATAPLSDALAEALEVDPEALPDGAKVAQLGAYDSPEVARQEWDKLAARFGDYMEGKQRLIQKASSGGRVFYRLRAVGFEDMNDARRFCSALVAERADCIPVTAK